MQDIYNIDPVSYTHLDVYKRQNTPSHQFGRGLEFAPDYNADGPARALAANSSELPSTSLQFYYRAPVAEDLRYSTNWSTGVRARIQTGFQRARPDDYRVGPC